MEIRIRDINLLIQTSLTFTSVEDFFNKTTSASVDVNE